MRRRTEIYILAAVLLVLSVLTIVSHREQRLPTDKIPYFQVRSSYRPFPEGYKALFLTLRQLGFPVQRQIRPYALLPERGLLIIADPYRVPMTRYEARRLLSWVKAGNHALIAVEQHPEFLSALADEEDADNENEMSEKEMAALEEALARALEEMEAPVKRPTDALPVAPSFLSQRAETLRIHSTLRFPDSTVLPERLARRIGGAAPLYRDDRGIAVAYSAVGDGGIVWCSSPWSFSNQGIREGQNLEFVVALAMLQPDAPVLFDDYHHGYGAGMSLWTITPSLARLGIAQVLIALGLLLLTLAWRFGPPRLPEEERFTRSRAEYLTAMAGLLHRARATHVVYQRLRLRLSRELGTRLGVPLNTPLPALLAANVRHPVVPQADLQQIVSQITAMEHVHRPEQETLLRLSGQVERLLSRKT